MLPDVVTWTAQGLAGVLGVSSILNATCSSLRQKRRLGSAGGGGTGHGEGEMGKEIGGITVRKPDPHPHPGRSQQQPSSEQAARPHSSLAGGGFRPKVLVLPASLAISVAGGTWEKGCLGASFQRGPRGPWW